MKTSRLIQALLVAVLLGTTPTVWGADHPPAPQGQVQEPVKLSRSGICHAPGSTYYSRTENFTPFTTLDACLKAGGRMPKR